MYEKGKLTKNDGYVSWDFDLGVDLGFLGVQSMWKINLNLKLFVRASIAIGAICLLLGMIG